MATYATVTDVEVRYGSPVVGTTREQQVEAWLSDVETTISAHLPGLADAVAAGNPSSDVVKMVVANAVVRRLQNPDGVRTTTVSVDDGSLTKTRGGSPLVDGTQWLTDDEWDLLAPQLDVETASARYAYTPGWCHDPLTPWGRP